MGMDLFAMLTGFLKEPGGWICLLLFVAVVLLVAVVVGLRQEITLIKQEAAHNVTPAFLVQFTNNANRQQLRRIRDAARKTAKEVNGTGLSTYDAMRRFERFIQAELDHLEPSRFDGADNNDTGDDDYLEEPSSAVSSSSGPEDNDDVVRHRQHTHKPQPGQAFDEVLDDDDDDEDQQHQHTSTVHVRTHSAHSSEYTLR